MKYGIKCHSTMCGITFYIIENTKELCNKALDNYKNYLADEPNTWEVFSNSTDTIFCSEDSDYDMKVQKLSNGNYILMTNRDIDYFVDGIEFELIDTFTERF